MIRDQIFPACAAVSAPRLWRPFLAAALAIAATAAHADYVFTQIDYPGASYTNVFGINSTGMIVGLAVDAGGNNVAFVYDNGTFAALPPMPPGYVIGQVFGINDQGTIVGSAGAPDGVTTVGFILSGSTYTFFTHSPQSYTEARSISALGIVTGSSADFDADGNLLNVVGYIYDPATASMTDIVVPGTANIIAQGINNAGQVVGNVFLTDGTSYGLFRDPGTGNVTLFLVDGHQTRARGINNNGLIAGFDYGGGQRTAFVGNSSGYQLLQARPDASETFAEGINDKGQLCGFIVDADGQTTHGFIASPASIPAGTATNGAYTFSVDVIPDTPVFIDPAPALGFDYQTGRGDPLFTSVSLPIGIGDSLYTLIVNNHQYPLAGGQVFDFPAHGYAGGVGSFRVTDIEVAAALDPANPSAFPTELTFSSNGRFTGSMTPLCINHPAPAQVPPAALRKMLAPCK